jgi:hypothetical protein
VTPAADATGTGIESVTATNTTGSGSLRPGQVAEAAGVNRQTLRYYERRGLLAKPARSPGGHRLYSPEAVTVLRVSRPSSKGQSRGERRTSP